MPGQPLTSISILSARSFSYEFMNSRTSCFDSILALHPYLQISMRHQFVPKMSYTYTYPQSAPITVILSPASTTISEAARSFRSVTWRPERDGMRKTEMFKNPFAQFLKLETDFVKYSRITQDGTLVGHVNAGIIWSYGNAKNAPYYEQFISVVPTVCVPLMCGVSGPGRYQPTNSKYCISTRRATSSI